MIDDENFWIIAILIVIVLGFINLAPKLEQHRNERLELLRKYPECMQAFYINKCVKYKRDLERIGS